MKNFLRIVAFLLAFLMVSSVFVACGEKPEENDGEETTASVETEKEAEKDDDAEVTQAAGESTTSAATPEAENGYTAQPRPHPP